jgi:hypothetical protein
VTTGASKERVVSKLSVLSPLGFPPKITAKGLAPSLDSLDGRKLFLVDVGFENSDNFMGQLQGWLADHEPSVRTEVARWADQHRPDPELSERIRSQGDAAILGVGL